jgi:hypothetical protein
MEVKTMIKRTEVEYVNGVTPIAKIKKEDLILLIYTVLDNIVVTDVSDISNGVVRLLINRKTENITQAFNDIMLSIICANMDNISELWDCSIVISDIACKYIGDSRIITKTSMIIMKEIFKLQ